MRRAIVLAIAALIACAGVVEAKVVSLVVRSSSTV